MRSDLFGQLLHQRYLVVVDHGGKDTSSHELHIETSPLANVEQRFDYLIRCPGNG
jgi:hypothetical protein